VTINQAVGQADPANRSPINFTVVFSKPVQGFTGDDVDYVSSTSGNPIVTVTGGPQTFNVAFTGMARSGFITAQLDAGAVVDADGEPSLASTSTDNVVEWWVGPLVTVNQAALQADPTNSSPVNFTVVFSGLVNGFTAADVVIGGSAGGTKTATVTGGNKTFNVAVTGMTTNGTVTASVPTGVAFNVLAEPNRASTSTDNIVDWWLGPLTTIDQAPSQADPSDESPIDFRVTFSSPVGGFTDADVMIGGTAGGTKTATVTGGPAVYNVAVTGMATAGTVIATVPTGVAADVNDRPNLASTSTDNSVTWSPVASTITLTTSAPIPPGAKDPVILWGEGFTLGVQFGANGANKTVQLQGTRDELSWTTISTLTTDAAGHASLVYRPVTNLFYRAVFAGTPDLAAATSNEIRTVVRQLAVMRPTNNGSTKSISRNSSITFSTTVRPSRPELTPATVTFSFYRQVSGAWQLVTSRAVPVDSAGVARTTFKFTTAGHWYVRSQAGPTPYNANSIPTPVERYSVG
jgi:hypothetical protein